MSLIDDIKRDRAAAQCYGFHWIGETLMALDFGEVVELFAADWSGLDECEAENKRRIARVPDMEAALLAADEFYNHILGAIDIIADGKPNTGIEQIYVALAEYEKATK